jgi:putative transposase
MHRSHSELYVHLVWATWNRLPLLTLELRPLVYGCVQTACRELEAEVLAIGGMPDHVHLLARMPTSISVAQLAKRVKGASSHLANRESGGRGTFKWQGGYGAFTVSKRNVPLVRDYIFRQEEHHREQTFHLAYEPPFPEE